MERFCWIFVSPGGVRGENSEKLEFDDPLNENAVFSRSEVLQNEVNLVLKRAERRKNSREEAKSEQRGDISALQSVRAALWGDILRCRGSPGEGRRSARLHPGGLWERLGLLLGRLGEVSRWFWRSELGSGTKTTNSLNLMTLSMKLFVFSRPRRSNNSSFFYVRTKISPEWLGEAAWDTLGASWTLLGALCGRFGMPWGLLGTLCRHLWDALGSSRGSLGSVSDCFWDVLGSFLVGFGAPSRRLECKRRKA